MQPNRQPFLTFNLGHLAQIVVSVLAAGVVYGALSQRVADMADHVRLLPSPADIAGHDERIKALDARVTAVEAAELARQVEREHWQDATTLQLRAIADDVAELKGAWRQQQNSGRGPVR